MDRQVSQALSGTRFYGFIGDQAKYAWYNKEYFSAALTNLETLISRASAVMDKCREDERFEEPICKWLEEVWQLIDKFRDYKIARGLPVKWTSVQDNIKKFRSNNNYRPRDYIEVTQEDISWLRSVHRTRFTKLNSARIGEISKYFSDELAKPLIKQYNDTFEQLYTVGTLYIRRPGSHLPHQTKMNTLLNTASILLNECPVDGGFSEHEFDRLIRVMHLVDDFRTSRIAIEIPAAWRSVRDNIEQFNSNKRYKPADYTPVDYSQIYQTMVCSTDKSQQEITKESEVFSGKAEELIKLYEEGLKPEHRPSTMYQKKPLCKLPTDYEKSSFIPFRCRLETMNKILRSLKEHGITLIHGPGGIGKTTMLAEIAQIAQEEKMFSRVVYAKLPRVPSLDAVQAVIAEQLCLSWSPGVLSDEDRSTELRKEIERHGKVLVILDDDWKGFQISTIGIPSIPPVGVKVLVGTRRTNLSFGAANKIQVEILTEEDSWSLLKKEAPVVETIPEILAKQVQAECCGLPLAIAAIGKALSGKEEKDWERAAVYLKNSDPDTTQFDEVEEKLYKIIKYSYDHLPHRLALSSGYDQDRGSDTVEEHRAKNTFEMNRRVFISFCLFQESEEVHVVDLKRYLAQDVANCEKEILENTIVLAANILEQYGLLQNHIRTRGTVKMHDVIRDVAVYIARNDKYAFIICGDTYLREKILTNCERLSLSNIKRADVKLGSSTLKTLQIRGNTILPDLFFEKMVKSLTMLDLSHSDISTLPSSMDKLQKVRTLLLNGCKKLSKVDVIVNLGELNELSLRNSVVQLLPKKLVKPTVLDWEDKSPAGVTHPEVTAEHVQGLRMLKEVSIASKHVSVEAFGKITEFQHVEAVKLYVTYDALESPDIFADAKTSKWKKFTIYNHDHCPLVSQGKHLSIMDLGKVLAGVKALLQESEEVVINHCFYKVTMSEEKPEEGAKTVLVLTQATGKGTFEKTKILRLQQCPSISYITSEDGAKFAELEQMELTSLEELIGIFEPLESTDNDTGTLFGQVEKIAVTNCDKIKCIMPNDLLQMVDKSLKVISVRNCKTVQCIFHPKKSPAVEAGCSTFSVLRSIEIDNLENLNCIWQGIPPQEIFKNLKEFFVRKCNKLTSLFTTHVAAQLKNLQKLTIEDNCGLTEIISADGTDTPSSVQAFQSVTHPEIIPHQETFKNLREFNVRKCNKLTSLFTTNVAEQLKSLQKLTVEENGGLTEIVRNDGANVALGDQSFPSVTHLSLEELPKLKYFNSNLANFSWRHLAKLNLGACPSLERLPILPNSAPRMSIIDLASSDDLTWYNQLVNQAKHLKRFEIWINNEKHNIINN